MERKQQRKQVLELKDTAESSNAMEKSPDGISKETVNYHSSHGQNVRGGLVSIAQGAVEQAQRAIANQAAAGAQAAFQAQAGLAQTAVAAAAIAQAALAGKQAILDILEQEYNEAQAKVKSEALQLIQAHRAATMAQEAAQQAQQVQEALETALNIAQLSTEQAQRTAKETSAEFAFQGNVLNTAKQHLAQLDQQLVDARGDLQTTEGAAQKAQAAARAAQENVKKQTFGVHGDHGS